MSGLPPPSPTPLPDPSLFQPKKDPFKPPSYTLTLMTGVQGNVNPWFVSPLVAAAQFDILLENTAGSRKFTISGGVQGAYNAELPNHFSPRWTGQGYVQMGPNVAAGRVADSLDLLNPFVGITIQNVDKEHAALGLALGNQSMWKFLRRKDEKGKDVEILSLIFNAQVVTAVDLTDGSSTGKPGGQMFLGLGAPFPF